MLDLIKRLLAPRTALPPHFHYHLDDRGAKILCDESICRPATRVPDRVPHLLPR